MELQFIHAGTVPYQDAWDEQRRLHDARVTGETGDAVILLEHPPVYTAGRRTLPIERPQDGTPVVDVDRGGKITWHGPGQLVGYPIVRLPDPIDVIAYVRRIEDALIGACAELGLETTRVEGRSGVWVLGEPVPEAERIIISDPLYDARLRGPQYAPSNAGQRREDRKLAAIGIRVSRGVTMHGFALNCDCDLTWFDRMIPCGIRDAGVTSLTAELGRPVTVAEVLPIVEQHLSSVFTPAVAAAGGSGK